jgi:hypothetical protein
MDTTWEWNTEILVEMQEALANNSKIWSKRTSNKNDNYKEMDRKHTGTK